MRRHVIESSSERGRCVIAAVNTGIDFGLLAGAGAPVRACNAGEKQFLFMVSRNPTLRST